MVIGIFFHFLVCVRDQNQKVTFFTLLPLFINCLLLQLNLMYQFMHKNFQYN